MHFSVILLALVLNLSKIWPVVAEIFNSDQWLLRKSNVQLDDLSLWYSQNMNAVIGFASAGIWWVLAGKLGGAKLTDERC